MTDTHFRCCGICNYLEVCEDVEHSRKQYREDCEWLCADCAEALANGETIEEIRERSF